MIKFPCSQYKSSRLHFCLHREVGISSLPGVTMIGQTTIPERPAAPRRAWPLALLAALLVAGTAIGLYLTRFHENALYGDESVGLANCPQDETTNCEAVNTSAYSDIAGIPISALGIPTYLLLLGLVAAARKRPRVLSYVFAIGLLTVVYSGYLYYVSTVKIGFLCVWCFRLYCINAGVPILAGLAAWRNPAHLLRDALDDLRRFVPEVRWSAAAFGALLVLTILADLGYRAGLTRVTAQTRAAEPSATDSTGALCESEFMGTAPVRCRVRKRAFP